MRASNVMYELLHPGSVNMKEPSIVRTKGRTRKEYSTKRNPSSFEYAQKMKPPTRGRGKGRGKVGSSRKSTSSVMGQANMTHLVLPNDIPRFMHGYITKFVNVTGDGHCGFRSVAESRGMGQEQWMTVRRDLVHELMSNSDLYAPVIPNGDIQAFCNLLDYYQSPVIDQKYWMTLPETGHLVATTYQCVFAVIGSSTFLPLRSISQETDPARLPVISAAFLKSQSHFVSVCI